MKSIVLFSYRLYVTNSRQHFSAFLTVGSAVPAQEIYRCKRMVNSNGAVPPESVGQGRIMYPRSLHFCVFTLLKATAGRHTDDRVVSSFQSSFPRRLNRLHVSVM